jgi:hypothetical protein
MSYLNDGGPAFPQYGPSPMAYDRTLSQGGMSLRDWFAAHALPIAANTSNRSAPDIAKRAYYIADAMLAEREKGQP